MKTDTYLDLKATLINIGYSEEIDWQTDIQPVTQVGVFRDETIWVILNSGMKEQIARLIWSRIRVAWQNNLPTSSAFKHIGKVAAIDYVKANCEILFTGYSESINKIEFLKTIPFIGPITCFHIAKNLGHDVVKPDRHLVRIAKNYGYNDCNDLCKDISDATGDKVSVVDIVLWRSANLGLI